MSVETIPIRSYKTRSITSIRAANFSESSSIVEREPYSGAFFDKDAASSKARAMYLKALVGGTVLISLTVFGIFSIYWGASWKSPVRNLDGWVVDFDGGSIGTAITEAITRTSGKVTWKVIPASEFPKGVSGMAERVVEEHSWAAIAINAGATARLNAALEATDPSYNGSLAITAYGVEARNENAYRNLIRPSIQSGLETVIQNLTMSLAKQLSNRTDLATLLSIAPQLITNPVYYTIDNLRPFDTPVATAVTFVGLIYLAILSFFVTLISAGVRESAGLERRLTTGSLIWIRILTPLTMYFFISLFYSLLSMAFALPFDRKFGHGGFVLFWMLSWAAMMAMGLALESMLTILTKKFVPFFLIAWIIVNVSVSALPIEVLPIVFRYGYAAPFYNVSRAVRTIVFSTKNRVAVDFAVLLTWIAISCITLPLLQFWTHRKEVNSWRKEKSLGEKDVS